MRITRIMVGKDEGLWCEEIKDYGVRRSRIMVGGDQGLWWEEIHDYDGKR